MTAPIQPRRKFFESLVWEKDGSLNLTTLMSVILLLTGCFAVVAEILTGGHLSNAAWAWMGGMMVALLVCSVPISRAKILANSELAKMAASVGSANIPTVVSTGLLGAVNEWRDGRSGKG